MNNIQKAFKNKAKAGLRMAVGGIIPSIFDDDDDEKQLRDEAALQRRTRLSDINELDAKIAMTGAMSGLSNTDRMALSNPGNQPYTMKDIAKNGGIVPGSAAEASMLSQRAAALGSLRDGLRSQLDRDQQNFANGGVVETPEQIMARMAAKYGTTGAAQAAPVAQAAPQPASQPASQPAQQPQQRGIFNILKNRAAQIDKAAGFADGGVVKISGPGTGTSDDIPLGLRSNGKKINVNVSNGEALAVLPAKTAQDPEAIDAVNDIIYQTNGKPPKGLRAGVTNYAADGGIDAEVSRRGFNKLYGDRSAAMAIPSSASSDAPINVQLPTVTAQTNANDIIYQTNGKPPKGLRAGGTYAEGSVFGGKVDEENVTPVRPKVSFGATPEQKASFAEKVNEFKQARWLRAEPVEPGLQERTFVAQKPSSPVVPIAQPSQAATPAEATAQAREEAFAKAAGVDPEVATAAQKSPLRAAGFMAEKDATQFTVPQGSGGGVITGAPDRNGLRRAMVMLPNGVPTQANPNAPRDSYGNDMTRTNDMKRQLAEIRRENTDSDLKSALPFYQQRGLRALAGEKMHAEADAARGKSGASDLDLAKFQLEMAKFQHDLKKTDNLQGNSDRDHYQKLIEHGGKNIEDEIKAAVGEDKDGSKLSAAKAYINNHYSYDPKVHKDPRTWTQQAMNNLRLEMALSDIGGRALTSEKDFNGFDKSSWDYDPNMTGGDLLRPGTWGRGGRFRNAKTGQVVSEGELAALPEPILNEFWSRVTNLPKDYVKRK